MGTQYNDSEIRALTRFALFREEGGNKTHVASFATATAADDYKDAMGIPGKHVDLYVVDTGRNVLADRTTEEADTSLARALDQEAKRKALLDIEEENIARAEGLKARRAALETPGE